MSNSEMCARIKVEIDGEYPNKAFLAREFEVPYNINVEEVIEAIKDLGNKYEIPISRVYFAGNSLTSNLWSKEQILNHLTKFAKFNESIKQEAKIK